MKSVAAIALSLSLCACATVPMAPKLAAPSQIVAPKPILGSGGAFMSPFTEDGTVAAWVEKGKSARAGSSIGGFLGAQAGQKMA